jgi:muramoyltetrapeptide carboxypeptidase
MTNKRLHLRVVSPGAIPNRAAVERVAEQLGNMGHKISFGEQVFSSHRYLAGKVTDRLTDLLNAFADPSVDVVWCSRGGYGSSELLPFLDAFVPNKPIVGYSDNTSLLSMVAARGGVAIHGSVFEELFEKTSGDSAKASQLRSDGQLVFDLLSESSQAGESKPEFAVTAAGANGPEQVTGKVLGGNLTTVVSLLGTPWSTSFAGSLVLLEDVGEPYYRVERLLLQLKQSGALAGASAVVLGDFHNCPQRGVPCSIADIFVEHLTPMGIPVFTGAPFGHGPRNFPWTYARRAMIQSGKFSWINASHSNSKTG